MKQILLLLLLLQILYAREDVTEKIEHLGNPYISKYRSGGFIYARNIWDMQVYDGKLFIGAGNSNNFKPAPNAGRVPVFSFDVKRETFKNEYTVAEDQIDRFRVIGDKLYIPGHDATQTWDFGNFYTRTKSGEWKKYRTIPNALHLYDIAKYNNKLFTALGLNTYSAVGVSNDNGKSWDVQKIGVSYGRIYSFLKLPNSLYACKSFTPIWHRDKYWSKARKKDYYSMGEYYGDTFKEREDLNEKIMFPNTSLNSKKTKKIIHSESLKNKAVYIGAYILNNGHQSIPFGAYIATSLEKNHVQIDKIKLRDGYIPWDIIVRDKHVYILTYNKLTRRVSVIYSSVENSKKWKELFYFKSTTFARSFELLEGDFYFGLGCEIKNSKNWKQSELKPQTGEILRVQKDKFNY